MIAFEPDATNCCLLYRMEPQACLYLQSILFALTADQRRLLGEGILMLNITLEARYKEEGLLYNPTY